MHLSSHKTLSSAVQRLCTRPWLWHVTDCGMIHPDTQQYQTGSYLTCTSGLLWVGVWYWLVAVRTCSLHVSQTVRRSYESTTSSSLDVPLQHVSTWLPYPLNVKNWLTQAALFLIAVTLTITVLCTDIILRARLSSIAEQTSRRKRRSNRSLTDVHYRQQNYRTRSRAGYYSDKDREMHRWWRWWWWWWWWWERATCGRGRVKMLFNDDDAVCSAVMWWATLVVHRHQTMNCLSVTVTVSVRLMTGARGHVTPLLAAYWL